MHITELIFIFTSILHGWKPVIQLHWWPQQQQRKGTHIKTTRCTFSVDTYTYVNGETENVYVYVVFLCVFISSNLAIVSSLPKKSSKKIEWSLNRIDEKKAANTVPPVLCLQSFSNSRCFFVIFVGKMVISIAELQDAAQEKYIGLNSNSSSSSNRNRNITYSTLFVLFSFFSICRIFCRCLSKSVLIPSSWCIYMCMLQSTHFVCFRNPCLFLFLFQFLFQREHYFFSFVFPFWSCAFLCHIKPYGFDLPFLYLFLMLQSTLSAGSLYIYVRQSARFFPFCHCLLSIALFLSLSSCAMYFSCIYCFLFGIWCASFCSLNAIRAFHYETFTHSVPQIFFSSVALFVQVFLRFLSLYHWCLMCMHLE